MTLPPIPDSSYKFLLYVGIVMIGYSFLQSLSTTKEFNTQIENSNSYIDSLSIKELFQKREKEKLIEVADELSKKYGIKNPISDEDSITYFRQVFTGPNNEVRVSDSLQTIWSNFKKESFEISLLSKKIKIAKANLASTENGYNELNHFYMALAILGLIFSIGGYSGMERFQKLQEKLILLDISQKDTKFKFCQSCGKNFSSIRINGFNENGEINPAFCIDCFDYGKFKEPGLLLDEFKQRTKIIVESLKSKKEKSILQKRFENLDRWKVDDYF